MLRQEDYPLPKSMENAFNDTDALVFEVDIASTVTEESKVLHRSRAMGNDSDTLQEMLTGDAWDIVSQKIEELGLDIEELSYFKPWYVSSVIQNINCERLGFKSEYGVDEYFYNRAQQAGKKLYALETSEYLDDILNQLSWSDQEWLVLSQCIRIDIYRAGLNAAVNAWRSGDIAIMDISIEKEERSHPDYYAKIISERNENWLPQIEGYLQQKDNYLVIVGAGHLIGPDGLINLLQNKGYSVKQMCADDMKTVCTTSNPLVTRVEEFPICTNTSEIMGPTISGNIVVWMDNRSNNGDFHGNWDIYGFNLSSNSEFPICTNPSYQNFPEISGDTVVWGDARNGNVDIYGYNLLTDTEFPICTNYCNKGSPEISGDIVVWDDDRNGNGDIYGYNLSIHTEFPICTDPADQGGPYISGDIVVWLDYRRGNNDIYGYNLSSRTEFPVCTNSADQLFPDISGDIVVWRDDRNDNSNIYGYNLSTNTEFPICTNPAWQSFPAISGNLVVWEDTRNGDSDIYGYNISTNTEFPVCTDPSEQLFPEISNNIVVWEDLRNGNIYDIYGARLSLEK